MWHKIMQYRDQTQECILLFICLSGCNTIFPDCSLLKSNQLTIDLSGADTVSAVVCHANEPETESGCSLSLSLAHLLSFSLSFFWHTHSRTHKHSDTCTQSPNMAGDHLLHFHNRKWAESLFSFCYLYIDMFFLVKFYKNESKEIFHQTLIDIQHPIHQGWGFIQVRTLLYLWTFRRQSVFFFFFYKFT